MNRIMMMAMVGCVAAAAHAENTSLSDSSKVFDIDEVVVVSQPKEVMRLRQQALSSTSMSSSLMKKMGASDLRDLSLFVPNFVMPLLLHLPIQARRCRNPPSPSLRFDSLYFVFYYIVFCFLLSFSLSF